MEEKNDKDIQSTEKNGNSAAACEEGDAKRKNGKALFLLLICAAGAFLFFRLAPGLLQPLSRQAGKEVVLPRSAITVKILKEKILEQQKFVTYTDSFEVNVESVLSKLNIPFTEKAVPGTTRRFSLTVPVTVDLTTDLENMEVSYDERENAASVTIPEAEIFRVTSDLSQMQDQQEIGFFRNRMTAEEQQAMLIEAERTARTAIYERNYISFANQRAISLLEEMIKSFGVKYAEVEVR